MSSHKRQVRASQSLHIQNLEQNEIFDDNLLPDALEIQRLCTVDPDIISWLKARAEQEQNFRHQTIDTRNAIIKTHNKREHDTIRIALVIYFILVLACLSGAFFLLYQGKDVQGSIFGGAAVVLALAVLITRKPTQNTNSQSTPKK